MFLLENEAKKALAKSLINDIKDFTLSEDEALKVFYKTLIKTISEADQEVDFSGLKERIKWFLGKIVTIDTLLGWIDNDLYKELFRNIALTKNQEGGIDVVVSGEQVTGNTKGLVLTYIAYSYLLVSSLTSEERTKEIGGAIITNASKILLFEAAKRADLSSYDVNGDPLKQIYKTVHDKYPLANLLTSLVLLLLLSPNFSQMHKALLLLSVNIVKTIIQNAAGYIYVFILKSGEILNINTKIIAASVKYQFKSLGLFNDESEKEAENTLKNNTITSNEENK